MFFIQNQILTNMIITTPDGKILQMTVDEYKQLYGPKQEYEINKPNPSVLPEWLGFLNFC